MQRRFWIIILLAIWRKGKCRVAPGLPFALLYGGKASAELLLHGLPFSLLYGGKASAEFLLDYHSPCFMAERQVQMCSWITIILAIWRKASADVLMDYHYPCYMAEGKYRGASPERNSYGIE